MCHNQRKSQDVGKHTHNVVAFMKSLHIFTPAVLHDVIHQQLFGCKVVPPPDACQSRLDRQNLKTNTESLAILFLTQNVLKMTFHLNTYFPVFHPFELGLKQSYPLLDEVRTRHQKIILLMVDGGQKFKNNVQETFE